MANFDKLFEVVMESNRITREMTKKKENEKSIANSELEKIDKINSKIEKLYDIINDPSVSANVKKKTTELINKYKKEHTNTSMNYNDRINNIKNTPNTSLEDGREIAKSSSIVRDFYIKDAKKAKKEFNQKYGIDKTRTEKKPGLFSTKESSANDLKLSIYESCRSGEITEEERDLLLEMM